MRIGYFLSSEEFGPRELVRQARLAEEAGFRDLWISDHYHPWNDEQGHSPFVWSTIGALAQATPGMKVTTAVTCPTVRIHPAVISEDMVGQSVPCGPDVERHIEAIKRYEDAGFDELYIQQIGPQQERFFEVYAREVLPRFAVREAIGV